MRSDTVHNRTTDTERSRKASTLLLEAGATKEEMNKIVPYAINGGQMWVFKRQLHMYEHHTLLSAEE